MLTQEQETKLDEFYAELETNKEKAIKFYHDAGICDEEGNLTEIPEMENSYPMRVY